MTFSNERKLYVPAEIRLMFDDETERWELSMDNGGDGLERIGFVSRPVSKTKQNNIDEAITNLQSTLFFFRHFARSFFPGESLNTEELIRRHDASMKASFQMGEVEE